MTSGGIMFHEGLGNMVDKVNRLAQMSRDFSQMWGLQPEEREQLSRASRLAKNDLDSAMVKEFPTLQGVMGKHYALDSGEAQAVAEAIEEHYLPIGTRLPKTMIGNALAILDKYDTLASYFSIGIEPTGDQDPYGLRRAAQGIVEVAWVVHRPMSLSESFRMWAAAAGRSPEAHKELRERVSRYLFDRLSTFAWPEPKPSADVIAAVLSTQPDDLVDAMERIRRLQQLHVQHGQQLLRAAKVVERTANILKGALGKLQNGIDRARLQEPLEQQLFNLYETNKSKFETLVQQKSYGEATRLFAETFYEPLHEFFDKVMVNVPEEPIRQNRLALMQAINTLYTGRVADLSKLAMLQKIC